MEEIKKEGNPEENFDYNITCDDVSVIQYDWLKEDLVDTQISEIKFSTTEDIDKLEEGVFLYHLDFRFELERFFYIHLRAVYRIETEEPNMFKFQPQKDMTMMTYDYIKDAVNQYHEDAGKTFNNENFDEITEEFWNDYISKKCKDKLDREWIGEDLQNLHKNYYTFTQDYASALVAQGTVKVMDEVFFYNPSFNHKANQDRLEQIIPPNHYITFRNQFNKLDTEEAIISFRKFAFLIVAIDCVCHLLTTNHLDYLEERLDAMNFGKELRADYIQVAARFSRDSKANIKSGGVTIGNWEENYDWDKLIT
ncbi:MAG: hypothetical protein WCL14_01555 [Bacteroidota bacterium]